MERVAVQVCTAVDLQKIGTSQIRYHVRVREIFHYPKRENFNTRANGLADGATRQYLGLRTKSPQDSQRRLNKTNVT
jgi:hypothetical protein